MHTWIIQISEFNGLVINLIELNISLKWNAATTRMPRVPGYNPLS